MTRLTALLCSLLMLASPAFAQHRHESPAPKASKANVIEVHRHPSCGCCMKWVEHLREAGFTVNVHQNDDMQALKDSLGVPKAKRSCHTGQVAGYFVEGHVPARDIQRLLRERPRASGVAVPGMPLGSPGMEVPNGNTQPYSVDLIGKDGTSRVYAEHGR